MGFTSGVVWIGKSFQRGKDLVHEKTAMIENASSLTEFAFKEMLGAQCSRRGSILDLAWQQNANFYDSTFDNIIRQILHLTGHTYYESDVWWQHKGYNEAILDLFHSYDHPSIPPDLKETRNVWYLQEA